MTYRNLTNINISLQTASLTRQGFGVPLFASSHRYFPERVRSYTSLQEASQDLPTTSNAYKAVQGYFSVSPSPSVVKIGRRDADLTLTVASGATSASLVVFATDGTATHSVTVNVTGQVSNTAVASAIAAAIEADPNVGPLVVASASTNTVSIDVASASVDFWVKSLSSNLSESYASTETPVELITAISDEDDDYYFFSCEDHSETFVLAAAAAIESRLKLYFTSVQDSNTLMPYVAGSSTSIAGKIADAGYDRTKVFFHHQANSVFPETTHVAANAPFLAGSVVWANIRLPLPVSQNPATGKALTSTEKGYLEAMNVSYLERSVGTGVTLQGSNLRNNKVASGEWIENIRGRDSMTVDLDAEYLILLTSRRGSKIPYTDEGVALLKNTCRNVLESYVLRGFIKPNYRLNFTPVSQVSSANKQIGLYNGGTFNAELQQGILFVDLTGTLSVSLG